MRGTSGSGCVTLREQIAQRPIKEVRENYARHLEDWAETDSAVRKSDATVLGQAFMDGDPVYVPNIEGIVDKLVEEVKSLRK